MAKRRMFSQDVVETDRFLELPDSVQNIYFHLGMNADDDGFITSARRIIACAGGTRDDLRQLIDSGFVIAFDTGVYVIRHWRINNQLRADRYKPTLCQDEFARLETDKTGAYALKTGCNLVAERVQDGCQTVNPDKERQGEYRLDKLRTDPQPPPLPTTGSAQLPDAADRAKKGGSEGENDQTDPNKPIDPDRVVALLGSAGVELTLQSEQCAQQLARQYGMEWFEKALDEAIGKHANHPLRYAEKVLQNWANGDGTPTAAREQIKRSRRVSRSYDQRTYTKEQDEAIFMDLFADENDGSQ